jgi:hypothetical protein
VSVDGLTVTTDHCQSVLLPAQFVTDKRSDGRPHVSHAWARTIDGVQGGTWDQVHLLATPALDRYRGYVGQSRSIQPTHTWNTSPAPNPEAGDHGGRLVTPQYTTAEQIAAALARAQPKTFATVDDPYRHERQIRAEQAAHQAHLDTRPADGSDQLQRSEQMVAARRRDLDETLARLAHWQAQHDATSGIGWLRPSRRDQHHQAARQIDFLAGVARTNQQRLDQAQHHHEDLRRAQAAVHGFDQANTWRYQQISDLQHQLDRHWTQAVVDAARDGHPTAYGGARLHAARRTLLERIETVTPRPEPGHPAASPLDDPLQALADLDRAIKRAAAHSPLRPVKHPRPPRPDPVEVHAGYQPPTPSMSIEL